jgi:hypothetical protein
MSDDNNFFKRIGGQYFLMFLFAIFMIWYNWDLLYNKVFTFMWAR